MVMGRGTFLDYSTMGLALRQILVTLQEMAEGAGGGDKRQEEA